MISITCFKGLPVAYESFLIQRYDSFVTTCRYIEIFHNPSEDLNYLLFHENDILMEVLLFEMKGKTITCLNSLAYLNHEIMAEIIKYMFNNFTAVQRIVIDSCYNNFNISKSVLFRKSDDFIIQLPITMEGYYQELGGSTRTHMRKYKNRLLKDYPTVNFVTKFGMEIDESLIDKIIHMNFDRMKYKGNVPHKDHTISNKIYKYSQHYGCVCYIEIEDLIIAGCIGIMGHNSISSLIIGHDNHFSHYNVGQLSMVYLIQISIEKGFSSMHLLWGELEYKTRFLAKPQEMLSYIVFRNYSLTYVLGKIKELNSQILDRIRLSKYSLPLRNAIKRIRKKSIRQLSKVEY